MKVNNKTLKSPKRVAEMLKEYQDWRKGVGKYSWDEDSQMNAPCPFSPQELSRIENAAIGMLNAMPS